MTDMFDGPGSAAGIQWGDLQGRLLLIKAHSVEDSISTAFGETSAVKADVVELDGPDAGTEHLDTLIFPKVLQGQVKGNAGTGRYNLGRLGRGQAKPGQSAPHQLGDPTDADKDVARRYLASQQAAPF
ncbi:hypothetical protein [Actinopolyspora halophila]|uniref:hypothetical protein n=1 Tax=Actinopolyspora halophila TaxID=1850 RepID=UPI0004771E02|nr:hypothetical protein [Actinopolyspora halophila]